MCRLLPESIPWLLSKGKLEEAKKIVIGAAKFNKVMIDKAALESKETEAELSITSNYKSPLAIFYASKMARFTWVMLYLWYV